MVGEFIRERRVALGLSQVSLAEALEMAQPQLSRLERGEVGLPQRATLEKLARALRVPLSELYRAAGVLEGVEEEEPAPPSGTDDDAIVADLFEQFRKLAPPGDPAHEQLVAIRAERVRLREAYRANLYTTAEMQQAAAALDERERAIAPATPGAARYAAELATLRDAFPTLPPGAQNAALAALVEAVTITGPACAIAPHPQLARLLGLA